MREAKNIFVGQDLKVSVIQLISAASMKLVSSLLVAFFYLQYYITITITVAINLIRKVCSRKSTNKIHPYHNTHQAVFMSIKQFIRMQGFKLDEHEFLTQDKALVHMWRIQKQNKKEEKPYPVVILHGLLQSSSTWFLTQSKSNSLPYLLAQDGYDVWVADNRGNRISQKHQDYQNYTIDHLVEFDQPAIINGVLNETQKQKLIFIGHSQGSTQLLLALGIHAELKSKIAAFVGLGTVLSFKAVTNRILNFLSKAYVFEVLNFMGFKRLLLLSEEMSRGIGVILYNSSFHLRAVMRGIKELIGLNHDDIIPNEMIGVIFTHEPGGGSVNNVLHWIQSFRSKSQISKFCYGKRKNRELYGSEKAPQYCLKHIKALPFKAYLFRGSKDALTSHEDFTHLAGLFNQQKVHTFELKEYNHLDYLWGGRVHLDIYSEIINALSYTNI